MAYLPAAKLGCTVRNSKRNHHAAIEGPMAAPLAAPRPRDAEISSGIGEIPRLPAVIHGAHRRYVDCDRDA
jgi:hypothetical protein